MMCSSSGIVGITPPAHGCTSRSERSMRGAVLGLAPLLNVEFQDGPPRAVGEVAAIVSDPDDPARVRFLPPHLASDGN